MHKLVGAIVFCVLTGSAIGQVNGDFESADQGTSDPAPNRSDVESGPLVTTVRIEAISLTIEPEVPSTFTLPLQIANDSAAPILLDNVSVRFLVTPGTYVASEGHDATCEYDQGQIEARSTRIAFCKFEPSVSLNNILGLARLAWNWRTLTFSPGTYQLLAVAEFQTTGEQIQRHNARTVVPMTLRPTIWQVVMGAGFGALLIALFVTWGDYHATVSLEKIRTQFRMKLPRMIAIWIVGWLAASIIVFMTYRMRDAGFPIAITVNDFYGGIVLGLFGFVLAKSLRERFFVQDANSQDEHRKDYNEESPESGQSNHDAHPDVSGEKSKNSGPEARPASQGTVGQAGASPEGPSRGPEVNPDTDPPVPDRSDTGTRSVS